MVIAQQAALAASDLEQALSELQQQVRKDPANQIKTQYTVFDEGGTAKKGDQKGWDLMKNETF